MRSNHFRKIIQTQDTRHQSHTPFASKRDLLCQIYFSTENKSICVWLPLTTMPFWYCFFFFFFSLEKATSWPFLWICKDPSRQTDLSISVMYISRQHWSWMKSLQISGWISPSSGLHGDGMWGEGGGGVEVQDKTGVQIQVISITILSVMDLKYHFLCQQLLSSFIHINQLPSAFFTS